MSSLLVRVDDYPGTKPDEFWKHNLENFKLFDEVMRRHLDSYALGVIPKHTSDRDLEWLKTQSHIRLALHGRNHDERFPNEFGDWETAAEVYQALRSLRAHLGDSVVYIPPHNVIDAKTVEGLLRSGFTTLWGGPGSDRMVLEHARALGMVTAYFEPPEEYGRSDELLQRGSVEFLRERLRSDQPAKLCLHWPWEFNVGLEHLDLYLSRLVG